MRGGYAAPLFFFQTLTTFSGPLPVAAIYVSPPAHAPVAVGLHGAVSAFPSVLFQLELLLTAQYLFLCLFLFEL
jgi:hypothetical protein